jgi:2-oxoglutaroyl-CoA hydrolase
MWAPIFSGTIASCFCSAAGIAEEEATGPLGDRAHDSVGITLTKDIVMRSKRILAKQVLDWGIATAGVADGRLEAITDALVDELRDFSPIAQRTAKKLLNDTKDATLSASIELEGHCYSRLRQSGDFREGVEAFHAKRRPTFRGG